MTRRLEGLEVSVSSISEVKLATSTLRIDPEYFQKRHLADATHVGRNPRKFKRIRDLGIVVDASAFYPSIERHYDSGDLPFYRVGDVDGIVDVASATRIPKSVCDEFPTLKLVERGDVLFTKGGAVDRVGYVVQTGAASRDLIFLKTSNLPESKRMQMFIYFSTEFFRRMLVRSSSQTAQPHLTVTLVRELPVFVGSDEFCDIVGSVVLDAYRSADMAEELLAAAEESLLQFLGLSNWAPMRRLSYSARASDIRVANRLDAGFFAPGIQELLDVLGTEGLTVGDFAKPRRERFRAGTSGRFQYIEIGDVDKFGVAGSRSIAFSDAPSRAVWHVKAGDVITSTVRPIRRLSAQVGADQDGYVCSSGFVVIRPHGLAGEVILTYLRLPVICELLDLYASASMYPAVKEQHVFGLSMSHVGLDVECGIVAKVSAARDARLRWSNLLDAAKRAVDMAIEGRESDALAFLHEMRRLKP